MPSSQIERKLCKNCNSDLVGLYCSECGQKNSQLLSIKETLKEFTDNVFSFDTRFFITLKYLITKPGLLTTEYWLGRRTKYLPPLRLYLVMSLMYFFISSIINPGTDISLYKSDFREKPFQFELDKSSPKYDPSPAIVSPFVDFLKENFNKGVMVIEKKELSEQDLVWSNMPTAMFILMPFMAFCVYLLNKKKNDAVVAVYKTHLNPYFNMMELGSKGFLKFSKQTKKCVNNRQDAPVVYQLTGFQIINVTRFLKYKKIYMPRISPIEIPTKTGLMIDNEFEFQIADCMYRKR